eukprot:COSAG02_NODE_2227_length_9447_cov_3.361682_3_plen_209_part_00
MAACRYGGEAREEEQNDDPGVCAAAHLGGARLPPAGCVALPARRLTRARCSPPQASLGAEVKPGRNVLMVKQDDMETEYALCSLTEGKLECTPLDLYFRDETVTFAVSGQCEIHLSGHVIDDAGSDSDEGSEEESEEEEATANGALPAARCVVGQTRTVPLTAAASVSQAPRSHPRQMMTTTTRTIARRTTTRVRTLAVFLQASCPRR